MAHAHTPHSLLAGQLLLTPENPPRTPPGLASWLPVCLSVASVRARSPGVKHMAGGGQV